MRWIVGSSLRFRFLVVAAAAALVFFGAKELGHQKVDVFPEFAPTRVEVQTACLGLSAAEVEELVTVPLEDALNGVPGVDVVRSDSVAQLSSITLLFKKGTDLLEARQGVQERLQGVAPTLPTWAAPPFLMQPVSSTSRIMKIGLSSERLSLMDLSLTAYWKIRARLLRVPGVSNIAIWGERLKQLQVQVQPRRMQAQNVSLDHVMEVTADALDAGILRFSEGSLVGRGGFVETPNQRFMAEHALPIVTAADLAQVPLAERGDRHIRVGDVAHVVFDHQPLIGDAVVNDGPGLLMVVEKFPGANTLEVTRGVDRALAHMRPGLPGVKIDATIFRPASFIEMAIDNLTLALLIGCGLVVLVLIAFLFEWRAAFISLVAIPLSLIAAAIVLDLRGATINTMVLAGFAVAVGVVVDDAIIDMENIVRRIRSNRAGGESTPIPRIILDASLEVRGAILYATLINVVAVLPVVFLGGLSGAFFQPLALSYALAVLASMAVALTVTPALSLILLSRSPLRPGESPLVRGLKRVYTTILARVIRAPGAAYGGVAVAALLGLLVLPALGQSLFPTFKERDFLMHWVSKPGTSMTEERRIVTRASRELRNVPGVRNFGSHIGQAFLGEEVVGSNFGENWISVDRDVDYDKTVASIEATVQSYPGLFHDVQTYLRERIDEVLSGGHEAIVVRISGDDLGVLRRQADRVTNALSGIDGLEDLHSDLQEDVPQIDVEVDLAKARRYGLSPGDVRRAAATLVATEEVGDVFQAGKAYDVHVGSTPSSRRDLQDIRELLIDTPDGRRVRLHDVADVEVKPTPNVIQRENATRRIDVGASVADRDLGAVTHAVERRLSGVPLPLGYHAEVLGEAAERRAVDRRLLGFSVIAALTVFLLLQAAFGSWRLALLFFLTLPMALVGGLLAAYAGVGVISLGALVGFFTVLGIAARNGILMITHFQHLERHEGETFGAELVLRGARERLAPILMTASATGLALLPLVLFGEIPGHEIEHPMAVVILGGLITSTLLNLFVVPALYLRFGRGLQKR
jgi:CzcA family heavy metal efflux pump